MAASASQVLSVFEVMADHREAIEVIAASLPVIGVDGDGDPGVGAGDRAQANGGGDLQSQRIIRIDGARHIDHDKR
jgi:hypothetical protein